MKHSVRVIGGQWKGRRIKVVSAKGLRPTPDFVRETLFNWIGSKIIDARCIDLFAGTGALGFEALSRGAQHVTFVEKNTRIASMLRQSCSALSVDASAATVANVSCKSWLRNNETLWDIAFVDPPFIMHDSFSQVLDLLGESMKPDGLVYVEYSKRKTLDIRRYSPWKTATSGEVKFELLQAATSSEETANISL